MKNTLFALLTLLFVAIGTNVHSQEVYKFWVQLHDKAGSTYTLDAPQDYLGPRALERRQRQALALDSLDLPVSQAYLQAFRQAGFTVQNRSKWLNGVVLFAADSALAELLGDMPFVDTVIICERSTVEAPDLAAGGAGQPYAPMPYDSVYDSGYYCFSYPQIAQLGGISLHRNGFEGQGLIIGVCDGGFPSVDTACFFRSMRDEGRLLATRDFVWSGDQVFSINGHGTKVLSLMASYLPGFFVGTAPRASYVLCRTENTERETILEEYNWISAAEYLDSLGADIITTSLGYFTFDDSTQNHTMDHLDGQTTPMSVAANIAVSRGMLVVNAAGNNGSEGAGRLLTPADAQRVLTVGAADIDNSWASFSSFGPTADQRIKPDVMALGVDVYGATAEGMLSTNGGTSLATPIMAGMMACLWQRYPALTPDQLCDSVRAWGSLAALPDTRAGYGIPDFSRAFPPDTVPAVGMEPTLCSDLQFRLWPNPCRDVLTLEVPGSASAILIQDMMGRVVMRVPATAARFTVSLAGVPRGLYFVTVVSPAASGTQRLLVQ